ncbi:MAG: NAD(P)-binding domain-containing protein [Nitrospira sp.]
MALVANATGLMPEGTEFHAPLAHTNELPDIYGPRATGGLLGRDGVLDVFNCLRRPDEASFAGGVFVVVELADTRTGELFAGKGIPVSRDRRRALIYNPSHLLGVEAPMSLLAASRLDHSILTDDYRLRVDLVCRATRGIAAGEVLAIEGTRHAVPALDPGLMPAVADSEGSPLPYYMAVGRTLRRAVAKGALLRFGDVVAPTDNMLWDLRRGTGAVAGRCMSTTPIRGTPPMTLPRLGFLGIGLMGEAMVRRLLDSGHAVTVWNLEPERLDLVVPHGAVAAASPADVARASDIVMSCVLHAEAVEAILFGPQGVAA